MIIYTLVARSSDGMILVESTSPGLQGNHAQITNRLLQKLTANPHLVPVGNRKTYSSNVNILPRMIEMNGNIGDVEMKSYWNGTGTEEIYENGEASMPHFFHVQRGEAVLYICLSDDASALNHRVNFGFLLDVQKEFTGKYTPNKILKANAYGMEKQFRKTLANMMHHCNTHRHSHGRDASFNKLHSEIESIKKVVGSSYDLMIRNQETIHDLVEKSDDLLYDAEIFTKTGRKMKKAMKRKNFFYKAILIIFALLLVYLMMVKLCGFDLSCKADDSSNSNGGGNNGYNYKGDNYGYGNNNGN